LKGGVSITIIILIITGFYIYEIYKNIKLKKELDKLKILLKEEE